MPSKRPIEMPMPEGVESFEIKPPSKLARDDFNQIKRDLIAPDGTIRDVRPVSLEMCPKCQTVHSAEGSPVCICVKCGQPGRIEWCGQCTKCAWEFHAENAGEAYADYLFPKYSAWKKSQVEKLKQEGLPWER